MNIENIINAWKSDEDPLLGSGLPTSPVGRELSDEELQEVAGGDCTYTCQTSTAGCRNTCSYTCVTVTSR